MIVDVAVDRISADLSAAVARGFDGVRAKSPIRDVEVVHMLFDDVVAAEPGEVIPVAHLPLHVAPAGLLWMNPDGPLIPVDAR